MNDVRVVPPRNRRGLRTGFTTGACATAAALAAARWLHEGQEPTEVTIRLPTGDSVTFPIAHRERGVDWAECGVIKDAGDDPDVTHGAAIRARVSQGAHGELELQAGPGVGTVTRPGLGLDVGGPAINPVPRQMLRDHLAPFIGEGLAVQISIPDGEKLAKKTLNPRLGIVGGLSILGTTGIVHPYSTAAWRASVEQAVDVAMANDQRHIVLCTGGRTEQYSMMLLGLPELAYVEMGEFTGHALARCRAGGVQAVTIAGMIGKLSKIAQGHLMTHVAANQVDMGFLADIARERGADPATVDEIAAGNTARHFQEIVIREGTTGVFAHICELVSERCDVVLGGDIDVECILFDFNGEVLGRAAKGSLLD